MSRQTGKASKDRARQISGFDALPASAFIDIPTAAAVRGVSESTFWKDAKERAGHPRVIKVSPRCSRIRVGELRQFMKSLEEASVVADS